MNKLPEHIDYLLSPKAIRDRTFKIYEASKDGKTNFQINEDKLENVASLVLDVIKDNYPSLEIPFHSRWGHFQVGGIDRNAKLNEMISSKNKEDKKEQARIKLDLAITSVLLDAGAGPTWKFLENFSGDSKEFSRSEGLGVASWHMFIQGVFATDQSKQLRADASKLKSITGEDIKAAFQVSSDNPLVGVEGRAGLLRSLGETVASKPNVFKDGRPGNIIDHMVNKYGETFNASNLLQEVLVHFGEIWPSRIKQDGFNLGDVWHHPLLGEKNDINALIPFHKLSQWLTYSLIEPIEEAGIKIENVAGMTGLAEYRNGGLLIDSNLIELRDPTLLDKAHKPDSEIIIEWRALTVVFLDKLAAIIRKELNKTEEEFPLAKVLEGGTWWAGRRLAKQKREDSSPPLKLDSDGTVF